jgi:hypothetical protein
VIALRDRPGSHREHRPLLGLRSWATAASGAAAAQLAAHWPRVEEPTSRSRRSTDGWLSGRVVAAPRHSFDIDPSTAHHDGASASPPCPCPCPCPCPVFKTTTGAAGRSALVHASCSEAAKNPRLKESGHGHGHVYGHVYWISGHALACRCGLHFREHVGIEFGAAQDGIGVRWNATWDVVVVHAGEQSETFRY